MRWARSPAEQGREEGRDDHLEIRRRRRIGRRLQGRLREGRRQGRQGADAAVPERRVPGAADRDRRDQARRGVRVLRRRRRGQVRQGLCGGRPRQDDSAVRPGLPDRRHARGAGRRGAGHADDAALRRRPGHAAATRPSARAYAKDVQAAARRLCGAGLRRGADARHRPRRRARATSARRRELSQRHREGHDRQPARHVHACRSRTTRCRTSTCARSSARRTRSIGIAVKALADPARGCKM